MCKYSYKLKIEVIQFYLENKEGYRQTSKYLRLSLILTITDDKNTKV